MFVFVFWQHIQQNIPDSEIIISVSPALRSIGLHRLIGVYIFPAQQLIDLFALFVGQLDGLFKSPGVSDIRSANQCFAPIQDCPVLVEPGILIVSQFIKQQVPHCLSSS